MILASFAKYNQLPRNDKEGGRLMEKMKKKKRRKLNWLP